MNTMNGLPYDTWRHEKLPIFIKSKALNEADDRVQMAMIKPDGRSSEEDMWTHLDSPRRGDCDQTVKKQ